MRYGGDSLSSRIELPDTMRNQYSITEGLNDIVYTATFSWIYFDKNMNPLAQAILEKRVKTPTGVLRKWLTLGLSRGPTLHRLWTTGTNVFGHYIFEEGDKQWDYELYRTKLIAGANRRGIPLAERLLDLTFGPLEREIRDAFRSAGVSLSSSQEVHT